MLKGTTWSSTSVTVKDVKRSMAARAAKQGDAPSSAQLYIEGQEEALAEGFAFDELWTRAQERANCYGSFGEEPEISLFALPQHPRINELEEEIDAFVSIELPSSKKSLAELRCFVRPFRGWLDLAAAVIRLLVALPMFHGDPVLGKFAHTRRGKKIEDVRTLGHAGTSLYGGNVYKRHNALDEEWTCAVDVGEEREAPENIKYGNDDVKHFLSMYFQSLLPNFQRQPNKMGRDVFREFELFGGVRSVMRINPEEWENLKRF